MDIAAIRTAAEMLGGAAAATFLGAALAGWLWHRPEPDWPPVADPAGTAESDALLREHALSAARRATAASAAARAARDRLSRADRDRDEAWQALERATAAQPAEPTSPAMAGAVAADGAVAHAAFVAFRHGDLSVDELRRLWGAPDPVAEQAERALRDSLATEHAARRRYDLAAAASRRAAGEAAVAEVAAQALAAEAAQAARDAAQVLGEDGGPVR